MYFEKKSRANFIWITNVNQLFLNNSQPSKYFILSQRKEIPKVKEGMGNFVVIPLYLKYNIIKWNKNRFECMSLEV